MAIIKKQYKSVGEFVFCLNSTPMVGHGTVTISVTQHKDDAAAFEDPHRHELGLENVFGTVSLDASENVTLIGMLNERLVSKTRVQLQGQFRETRTGKRAALRAMAALSNMRTETTSKGTFIRYDIDPSFASEYPIGSFSLMQC